MIDYKIFNRSPYTSREERSLFPYNEYGECFSGSVLDVGGYRGALGEKLKERYVNIDMDDSADFKLNLDAIERLPFDDRSFDTVVCTDVLEHLENIHLILGELFRVASKSVVISMPNAWISAKFIFGGLRSQISKARPRRLSDRHWTLPLEKPADRHRWFYSLSEADELIRHEAKKAGFVVDRYNPHVLRSKSSFGNAVLAMHRRLLNPEDFVNLHAWVGWWTLVRSDEKK